MATRRAKRQSKPVIKFDDAIAGAAMLGLIVIAINNPSAFFAVAVVGFACFAAFWLFRRRQRAAKEAQLFGSLSEAIRHHENALVSYYHQSRREDLFGNHDETKWHDRVDTFLRKQVVPDIANFAVWRSGPIGQKAAGMVHDATAQLVSIHRATNPLARVDTSDLTPLEYERHCAELLRAKGWFVQMTPATRDGGADFIAEKHDWRMIVQCKRYTQPVGNKAVQEVTSALLLYNGNVACVVAPTGFTRQAQQEAHAQKVELLHHSALPTFAERLSA